MSEQTVEGVAGQRKPGDGSETPGDPPSAAGIGGGPSSPSPIHTVSTSPSDTTSSGDSATATAATWRPNVELLDSIVALGFDKLLAEKALFYTGNDSLERAVNWVIDYGPGFDDGKRLDISKATTGEAGASVNMIPQKMVFVVNNALKMGVGKIAAQVGHASLGLYRQMLGYAEHEAALFQWSEQGETKVVLKADGGEEELVQLMNTANQKSLQTYLVADAGRTQIASGSVTVLSVFGPSDSVDEVTGKLKLLQ